jgi:hypothetical protein
MQRTPSRLDRPATGACLAAIAACVLAAIIGCSADAPARLTTNIRSTPIEYDPARAVLPSGEVTLEGSLDAITVAIENVAAMPGPPAGAAGFVYEGWVSYPDTGQARFYISTGRFTLPAAGGSDPNLPTANVTFLYDRDGNFTMLAGGNPLTQGEPLPDTLDFTERVRFILAIEPEPDTDPGIGPIHVLVTNGDLPESPGSVQLIVPVDVGDPDLAGRFDILTGSSATLNAATGEFSVRFQSMPFINRTEPPGDVGLIYQVWFADDDTNPPRLLSVARENPNVLGDLTLSGAVNPGDADGDGVPEPLDLDRVIVSIEPDGITSGQPPGQGVDTSNDIFPMIPYQAPLPNVLP